MGLFNFKSKKNEVNEIEEMSPATAGERFGAYVRGCFERPLRSGEPPRKFTDWDSEAKETVTFMMVILETFLKGTPISLQSRATMIIAFRKVAVEMGIGPNLLQEGNEKYGELLRKGMNSYNSSTDEDVSEGKIAIEKIEKMLATQSEVGRSFVLMLADCNNMYSYFFSKKCKIIA